MRCPSGQLQKIEALEMRMKKLKKEMHELRHQMLWELEYIAIEEAIKSLDVEEKEMVAWAG